MQVLKRVKGLIFCVTLVHFTQVMGALNIGGYFDMEYVSVSKQDPYFRQHHLNLLLDHEIENYKFFTEIEFEDAVDLDYGRTPTKTANGNNTRTGRLFIERAWAQIHFNKLLNIRLGQMLHDSLFLQNHYPSIYTAFTDPSTKKQIFNYNIKGIRAFGEIFSGLSYSFWTGRGPIVADDTTNHENGVDWGGKLNYSGDFNTGDFELGLLFGNYNTGGPSSHNFEKAMGLELNFNYQNLTLWMEYGLRSENKNSQGTYTLSSIEKPKKDISAYYFLMSYNFELNSNGEISPYILYDSYKKDGDPDRQNRFAFGVNYRPISVISTKLEYLHKNSYDKMGSSPTNSTYVKNVDQIAVALIYFYN